MEPKETKYVTLSVEVPDGIYCEGRKYCEYSEAITAGGSKAKCRLHNVPLYYKCEVTYKFVECYDATRNSIREQG